MHKKKRIMRPSPASSLGNLGNIPGLNIEGPLKLALREPTIEDLAKAETKKMEHPSSSYQQVQVGMLGLDQSEKVRSRLPKIDAAEVKDFFKREKSLKPPTASEQINVVWPPQDQEIEVPEQVKKDLEAEESKELQILRFSPQGEVSTKVKISVTFSHPMIAVSSVENVEKQPVPVLVSPDNVKGRWRWIGTKTLHFESDHRLPRSTLFKVSVPKGTKSSNGATLNEDFSFEFKTSTVMIERILPSSSHVRPTNFIGMIEFDQDIEGEKVVDFVTLGDAAVSLMSRDTVLKQLEDDEELRTNPSFSSYYHDLLTKASNPTKRQIFFTLDGLNRGTTYNVCLKSGCPSAEGPLKTEENQRKYAFTTFGPMKLMPTTYEYLPYAPWSFPFSNNIEASTFEESYVNIVPSLSNMSISISGSRLSIRGRSKGNTKYKVTFSPAIKDVFGQNLLNNSTADVKVKSCQQSLNGFQSGLVILDPTDPSEPSFDVVVTNIKKLRFCIIQVKPDDYANTILGGYQKSDGSRKISLPKYLTKLKSYKLVEIDTECEDDVPKEISFPISEYLQFPNKRLGQVLVGCEPVDWPKTKYTPRKYCWFQATDLCIDYHNTGRTFYAFVNQLSTGKRVEGATVSLKGQKSKTNAQGIALIETLHEGIFQVVKGDDTSFLYVYHGTTPSSTTKIFVFDDRKLYKPKETVNLKGFARSIEFYDDNKFKRLVNFQTGLVLTYKVYDSRLATLCAGKTKIKDCGAFHISFSIPDNANLGTATVQFSGCMTYVHRFNVEEFRTPEYQVSSSVCGPPNSNFVVGGQSVVETEGKYYSGGALTGAQVTWKITQTDSSYTPPGLSEYSFQKHIPSYWHWRPSRLPFGYIPESTTGTTDPNGKHQLCIAFSDTDRKTRTPIRLECLASIQDINRQTISAATSFIVHPSSIYVGCKMNRTFVPEGFPAIIDVIVSNIDGKLLPDIPIQIKLKKWTYVQKGFAPGVFESVEVANHEILSSDEPKKIELNVSGGQYEAFLTVKDMDGNVNSTEYAFTVEGGKTNLTKRSKKITPDSAMLIANKVTYRIGDDAKILVTSPFDCPTEGFMTVTCSDIVQTETFKLDTLNSIVLTVPIKKGYTPGCTVHVTLTGTDFRVDGSGRTVEDAPKRPAYADGAITLQIPPNQYRLNVNVKPKTEIAEPGADFSTECSVTNVDGERVSDAFVTFMAVDEAVLSLTGYTIGNPLNYFWSPHMNYWKKGSSRSLISVKDFDQIQLREVERVQPEILEKFMPVMCAMSVPQKRTSALSNVRRSKNKMCQAEKPKPISDEAISDEAEQSEISVRSNFQPLAVYVETIRTNKDGIANVTFKLPDNLTKFRLTAVCVKDSDYYGIGESFVQCRLPISIRPSLPRFLNFGDKVDFSVVLENQSAENLEIHVVANVHNLKLLQLPGFKVKMPPNQRTELRFPIETDFVGTGKFQVGAVVVGTSFSDATLSTIPVYTPATSEAFATYGEIDKGVISQRIARPNDIFPQFGGLEIQTTSTAVSSLTDAFIYLYTYKFSCGEQIASRLLSICALYDVLEAFKVPELPSRKEITANLNDGLKKLKFFQLSSGAFTWWPGFSIASPYVTLHIAHCLVRCSKAGFEADQSMLLRALQSVHSIKNWMDNTYSDRTKLALRSKACYVLAIDGRYSHLISHEVKEIYAKGGGCGKDSILSLESLAWLAFASFRAVKSKNTLVTEILKHFANIVNETPQTANFITDYGDEGSSILLHSNRRTDAIILEVLMELDQDNDLIPKIVKGLMAHKKKGRWGSTQENIFILIALEKYFKIYERIEPNFVARIWFGDTYCGDGKFEGRETKTLVHQIPFSVLDQDEKNLILFNDGVGRLYYRIAMNYCPTDLQSPPKSYGFSVSRRYEGVTDPSHVQFKNGKWCFKSGELVRVCITMENSSRRYHVALVDNLPACLEAINPALKGSELSGSRRSWWNRAWYEHHNIRDERVEAFTSYLYPGSHEFIFLCRCTGIGEFIAPPSYAEEMYAPELFGKTVTDNVIAQN